MAKFLGSLCVAGMNGNEIFNLQGPYNRDGCLEPYVRLQDLFLSHGVHLNTPDMNLGQHVDFEIHLNLQQSDHPLRYLLQMETKQILPKNFDLNKNRGYRKIFTWHDDLVDGQRHIKLNFPNPLSSKPVPSFAAREKFACLISANKAVLKPHQDELYSERVKTIRWFEANAPQDFELYGIGWHLPACKPGLLNAVLFKIRNRFSSMATKAPFASYKGKVESKAFVLQNTRFCICYENVKNTPGYITEKIFDCFFSGCVPVYWGAPNVSNYIPSSCYIDRSKFSNHAELYAHLKSIDAQRYAEYQQNIHAFLQSERVRPFGAEAFAETIVKHIVNDLTHHES